MQVFKRFNRTSRSRDANKIPKEKFYIYTGSQGEPLGALNRIVNETHPDVNLDSGDTVIFSSKIIPGNEKNYTDYKI